MMIGLRAVFTISIATVLTACSVVEIPQRSVPQRAIASTTAEPVYREPIQLNMVTVDWQDVSILKQPQIEAKRLSGLIYSELEELALVSEVATDKLRVTVLEMFLRSGSRTGISTDYMTGEIELMDATGNSKRTFRIKANYTRRGGDPVATEARLDKLYAKFTDLTIRELTVHLADNDQYKNQSQYQSISYQQTRTSAGEKNHAVMTRQ